MRREHVRRASRRGDTRRRAHSDAPAPPAAPDAERARLLERSEELLEVIEALLAHERGA